MNSLRSTRALIIFPALLGSVWLLGCGSAQPPKELVDARAAYQRAQTGPAAQYDPADLHVAATALQRAEQFFKDYKDSTETRDVAYVAQRRAQLAEARAGIAQALQARQQAEQQLQRMAQGELHQTREQLDAMNQRLAAERAAREEAERRAQDAANRLSSIAAVKQDPRGTVITLSGSVLFASGKWQLLPSAKDRLDQVASVLKEQGNQRIVIEGYTDSMGSDKTNQTLSQKRAESVRDYLISKGVSPSMLQAEGMGEANPVAENTTPEGRANNRRVEIVVQNAQNQQAGAPGFQGGSATGAQTGSGSQQDTSGGSQRNPPQQQNQRPRNQGGQR